MDQVDKLFVAMKAFIVKDGKVLLLRENTTYPDGTNADKWIEPGGRVQPGEQFMDGLKREIAEETGLEVSVVAPFYVDEWRPKVRGEQWQIVATFFVCTALSETINLGEDHEEYRWVGFDEVGDLPVAVETIRAFVALKKWLETNRLD